MGLTFDGFPPQHRDRGLLVGDSFDVIGPVWVDPDDRRLLQVLVTQAVPHVSARANLNPAHTRVQQPYTQIS